MATTPSPDFVAAIACHQRGDLAAATALYRKLLADGARMEKKAASANLGRIFLQDRNFSEAAACFRVALVIQDDDPALWSQLGAALLQSGDPSGAATAFRQALVLKPADADTNYNLALALAALGEQEDARTALSAALQHRPHFPDAHNNLGTLALAAARPQEALTHFSAALALRPDFAAAWFNRGLALRAAGLIPDSGVAFARAVALQPDFAAAHANLGRTLQDTDDFIGAEAAYERALALAPMLGEVRTNRAERYLETGDVAAAIGQYEAAHRLAPDDGDIIAGLLHAKQFSCDWSGQEPLAEKLFDCMARDVAVPPFVLVAMGATDALQTRNAGAWAAKVAPQRRPRPLPRTSGDGRIRLGYLSGDFHDHATAQLIVGIMEQHDRTAFTVQAYSYGPDDGSPMRERVRSAFDSFSDMRDWSFADSAGRIAADGIDILIDLKGYTAGARPQIPALRPAPVQVNWLGYPGSMGVDFIDYVIADPILAPFSLQKECVEEIVHLPDCFQPNDAHRSIGPPSSRADYSLPEKGFVFCCFNNSYKITRPIFDVWIRLLNQTPGSVLWLLDCNSLARGNMQNRAAEAGVAPERLVFAPRLPSAAHLARHRLADLFLDTLPVNALTTASDALYAGLPVLTCLGNTVAGRGCASLLHAAGLADMITDSLSDYESLAMMLAQNPSRLSTIRESLLQTHNSAPLFDTKRFVDNLESCYRRMHSEVMG